MGSLTELLIRSWIRMGSIGIMVDCWDDCKGWLMAGFVVNVLGPTMLSTKFGCFVLARVVVLSYSFWVREDFG